MTAQAGTAPMLIAMLCGCAQAPEPLPEPAPIVIVDCRAPAELVQVDPEPSPPAGEYTQRDVARYVVKLAAWGRAGWARVGKVREHAQTCGRGNDGPR